MVSNSMSIFKNTSLWRENVSIIFTSFLQSYVDWSGTSYLTFLYLWIWVCHSTVLISPVGLNLSSVSTYSIPLIRCGQSHVAVLLNTQVVRFQLRLPSFWRAWLASSRIMRPKFEEEYWTGIHGTHILELGGELVYRLLALLVSRDPFLMLTRPLVTRSLLVLWLSSVLRLPLLNKSLPLEHPSMLRFQSSLSTCVWTSSVLVLGVWRLSSVSKEIFPWCICQYNWFPANIQCQVLDLPLAW